MRWKSTPPGDIQTSNIKAFAVVPTLMNCGTWLWWEHYYQTWTEGEISVLARFIGDPLKTLEPIESSNEPIEMD